MAWLSNYKYRKKITVTGQAGSGTNYTIPLEVHSGGGVDVPGRVYLNNHSLVPLNDVRFTTDDGVTLLPQWLELVEQYSYLSTDKVATYRVQVAADLGVNRDIYIYYGRPGTAVSSDPHTTFITGNDFDDGLTTGLTINEAGAAAVTVQNPAQLHNLVKVRYGSKVNRQVLMHGFPTDTVAASTAAAVNNANPIVIYSKRASCTASGRIWIFYTDGVNLVWRSSLDGVAWTGATNIRVCISASEFCVFFDGRYIHYAYSNATVSGAIFYRRGLLVRDGTITWSAAEQTVLALAAGFVNNQISISVDSAGYAYIGYMHYVSAAPATSLVYVTKNNNNDGTWATAAAFPYSPSVVQSASWQSWPIPLLGKKVCLLYGSAGATLKSRTYDFNGGGWAAEEAVTASNLLYGAGYMGTSHDDEVDVIFLKPVTFDIVHVHRNWGQGWGAENTVQAATTNLSIPTITASEDSLFCFWAGSPTADHVFYKKYVAGVWDAAPTDWIDESVDTFTGSYHLLNAFHDDRYGMVGVLYQTKAAAPFNVRFAGLTSWDGYYVRDLCPVLDANGYMVPDGSGDLQAYYFGVNHNNGQLVGSYGIGRITSSDGGKSWTKDAGNPVLEETPANAWEAVLAGSPGTCLYLPGIGPDITKPYKLFYIGFDAVDDGTAFHGIGLAESADGVAFTKYAGNPLLLWSDFTDVEHLLAIPWTIKTTSGKYVMVLEGYIEAATEWRAFGATADTPEGPWTPMNGGDPILVPTAASWDQDAVANPKIVEVAAGQFILAYNGSTVVAGEWWFWLGFVTTLDLPVNWTNASWTQYANNPVIMFSEPQNLNEIIGHWDGFLNEMSAITKDDISSGATYFRLWFNGFDYRTPRPGIGLALIPQGRIMEANGGTLVADSWVVGEDLAGVGQFMFEILIGETRFESFITGSTIQIGLIDDVGVPVPVAAAVHDPKIRFTANKFNVADVHGGQWLIQYVDGASVPHYWNGVAWTVALTRLDIQEGLIKVKIADDGVNYTCDLIYVKTGLSALAAPASVAKAAVGAFANDRVLIAADPYNDANANGGFVDNWLLRRYNSPEPSADVFGSEERQPAGATMASALLGVRAL